SFPARQKTKKKSTISGRILAKRGHGGASFADIKDASGKLQLLFKEDTLGADAYALFASVVDVGDILEVTGVPFTTKRGEKTIEVLHWVMLSKSLRPLPEKWHGLQDVEERFRKRSLDLIMNEDVRVRFLKRSHIIRTVRDTLADSGFEEVETPMLQHIAGGALAKPFKTHHNALDLDLYLRIAPELFLKRLLVGGLERVFEIGRDFRNEGIDATHNPEFTMLEAYAAWWDEESMMKFTEELFLNTVKTVCKKGEFEYDGAVIKIKTPFPRAKFTDLLKKYALIADYEAETRDSIALKAQRLGLEIGKHEGKGKIADEIYKKICRPHLKNPTFITNHPLDISPLAKKRNSSTVRRFQLVVGGLEIVNAFSELNDP
ncbi:MAG: lysine--tRNA ligase, partial [Candidatus Sungbacteria bacterium]|nr:lysine--tRNA ligase [Candidatus Sungbacteria bacterium]